VKVELSDEAESQVLAIDSWWREHRPSAPDLFAQELEYALRLLKDVPSLGVGYDDAKRVRRLLLRKTGHHVYFTRSAEVLSVVAVWSGRRGHGPPLP
jgi:plasmid stabilization system protein ParE